MSIADATARVAQIQSMFEQLQTGAAVSESTGGAAVSGTEAGSASGGATSFATQLAQAQGASFGSVGSSALDGASATSAVGSGQLTSDQQQFASRLASDTGLDPHVIGAWLYSEENGSAATARQAQSNNDWLNIGYTDSGTYGSQDGIWSNPLAAADATAGWLKGQSTISGYGTASSGVQAILATAGQPPATQIAAIQRSGWASSGYPDLPSVYQQLIG